MGRDRDLSARRCMEYESPAELAARVERNRLWMERYGGVQGLAALTAERTETEDEKEEEEETKESEELVVVGEDNEDTLNGSMDNYQEEEPEEPEWDDQDPNDLEQEPPVDPLYCGFCLATPCLFLQWEDELTTCVDILHSEASNKAKRFHMYRHMSRRLHGPMGPGRREPLPGCFVQGLRDLYPQDDPTTYTGFKHARDGDAGDGTIII
jgi:hypothetical protein